MRCYLIDIDVYKFQNVVSGKKFHPFTAIVKVMLTILNKVCPGTNGLHGLRVSLCITTPPIQTLMELYVKNMQSAEDIRCVHERLLESGLHPVSVQPEKVIISERAITSRQFNALKALLAQDSFELVPEAEGKIVMTIKAIIMEQVHYSCREKPLDINFTAYISYKLNKAYTQLSHIFSTVEGITIKQFIIQQKTERVKQLLFEDMPLAKVATRMSYSSVQHLSSQFKKITGVTPVQFREQHALPSYTGGQELFLSTYEA